MRHRRLWTTVLGILILVAALVVYAAWPGSSTFTVGEETTYITEPLDEDGYLDYEAALNDRLGKDITPERNANVLIWKALGPRPERGNGMPAEYFKRLGIEEPPDSGDYLVALVTFLRDQLKLDANKYWDIVDQQRAVTQRAWAAKDYPEVAAWLKANEKPLVVFVEATKRPGYFNPLVSPNKSGLVGAPVPSVQKCREAANAFAARAMLRVAEGNFDDAWQDLLACHRLARLLGRGATLIEFLVGIAIDVIASKADVAFLERAPFTSKQDLACLQELRRLPPVPAVADKIDLGERFMLLDAIMMTARYGTEYLDRVANDTALPQNKKPFGAKLFTRSINWDPAFRNANRVNDRYVAALHMTDRIQRVEELAVITQDVKVLGDQAKFTGWPKKQFMGPKSRGEVIGNFVIRLFMPALDKLEIAERRYEQEQRNLHVAFALAAHQRDHGRYPAKLDELAPHYLERIPDDLFAAKPLIYRLDEKGYLLYSVGVNGTDDGGRGSDDEPPGDDLVVRMPIPALHAR